MKCSIRILLTGSGAPGTRGTVYCIKKGAHESGIDVEIVGADINPQNSGKGFCSKTLQIPKPDDPNYGLRLTEICEKQKINVILPQTTKEIEWFANSNFSIDNVKVLVNKMKTVELFNDKLKTAELFRDNGLGFPAFYAPQNIKEFDEACYELGYPDKKVVVKLAVSNGMRGLRILNSNPWDFIKFSNEKPSGVEIQIQEMRSILLSAKQWPRIMVCEFLEGDEYSVDCYRGPCGELAIPRKRNSIRSGISFITTLEKNTEIIRSSLLAARIGYLEGVFGFQFKMSKGEPKVLECNPRVQGTMVASLISGNNIIWKAIADLLPEVIDPISIKDDWLEGVCYRYWGATLEHLNGNYLEMI
jgi:carbamoyl-phosphate synthase large subunit